MEDDHSRLIRQVCEAKKDMAAADRLIDYTRKEKKHKGIVSIETPIGDNGDTIGDQIPCGVDSQEELLERDATKKEIEELSRQMEQFGVSLTDVANNCPRQKRTLKACQKVLTYEIIRGHLKQVMKGGADG